MPITMQRRPTCRLEEGWSPIVWAVQHPLGLKCSQQYALFNCTQEITALAIRMKVERQW